MTLLPIASSRLFKSDPNLIKPHTLYEPRMSPLNSPPEPRMFCSTEVIWLGELAEEICSSINEASSPRFVAKLLAGGFAPR